MASQPTQEHPYFADLYTFDWKQLSFREPLVGAIAVGICLIGGSLIHHPAAGLIAGGGAMTVGFGINQRIANSRLWPMIAATLVMALSTMAGMLAGHNGVGLLVTAAIWGLNYGLLTSLAPGIAWVGQQAAVTLFVSSAFPADLYHSFLRALLILGGGALQILITSICLRILPELGAHLGDLPGATRESVTYLLDAAPRPGHPEDSEDSNGASGRAIRYLPSLPTVRSRVQMLFDRLPYLAGLPTFPYAVRLSITVLVAAEAYRQLGIQSGYWVPMTALLVQKPAFAETLNRALMRMGGTVVGAGVATFCLAHVRPEPMMLAVGATVFALGSYCTVNVNYGLYSLFLTTYIVFLLSLNTLPAPVIAHRRALCTIAGGLVALIIHLDGLRALRKARRELPAT